jgi:hypothetical protein
MVPGTLPLSTRVREPLAGLGSGVGLLRVRARPSSIKRHHDLWVELPIDADGPVGQIDVTAAQGRQFAPAQAAEGGEQDQGAVTPVDGLGQRVDLGDAEDRPLWRGLLAGTFDPARVAADQPVIDSSVHDGFK